MRSIELGEFLLARIESRTNRVRKATEEKNINFDIKQFKEESRNDLQTAAEITEKLIEESEDKESCDEIGKKFLKVQQELEEAVDAYDMSMRQKWLLILLHIWSVFGSCLSTSTNKTANYIAKAVKINKWPLLCQVVTTIISIICYSFRHEFWSYYDCSHEYYHVCDQFFTTLPAKKTIMFGSSLSISICVLTILFDLLCASNSIRSRLEGCVLCSDLISAGTLCLDWAIMLATSVFVFKSAEQRNYTSQKRHAILTMVLSSMVILIQAAVFVIKLVQVIKRKIKQRAQRRMMGNREESWSYSGMLNVQEEERRAGELRVT